MFAFFKLVPLRDWLFAIAIALIAAFGIYEHYHLIDVGIQRERAAMQAKSAQAVVRAQKTIILDNQQHAAALAATVKDYAIRTADNQRRLDADAQRLREYDAYRRAHPALASSAHPTLPGSNRTPSSPNYEASFESLESVALGLAGAIGTSDAALTACQQERNSLTGR
ncbi:MAG: hypothetical protein KGL39_42665 [Patescibacteria group bacterium]|nr:hypothetical protein [Patescibacteria group bacterium]